MLGNKGIEPLRVPSYLRVKRKRLLAEIDLESGVTRSSNQETIQVRIVKKICVNECQVTSNCGQCCCCGNESRSNPSQSYDDCFVERNGSWQGWIVTSGKSIVVGREHQTLGWYDRYPRPEWKIADQPLKHLRND